MCEVLIFTVDSYAIKTNLKTAQNLATSLYHIGAMNLYIVKVQNGYFEDYIGLFYKCNTFFEIFKCYLMTI